LVKHIYAAMNMHTRVEESLGVVFFNQSTLKLYENSQTGEVEDRSHRTWKHEGESSLLEAVTRQQVCENIAA
jgi:hypothetical protein